jgi:surface-anchored protein
MKLKSSLLLSLLLALPLFATPLTSRLRLTEGHVDLRIVFAPEGTNLFQFVVSEEDKETNHFATNVVLVVPETAKLSVPAGFPELGDEGDPLWVLPQTQDSAFVLLGISAEGLPEGLIAGQPEIQLLRVEGAGHLLAWQTDPVAGLTFALNTRDGATEADRFTPPVGGHQHFNFGFTTNGLFTAVFRVRATVDGKNAWSAETPLLFAIEPVPALTPFQQWQADHWPGVTDAAIIGPAADPDADGEVNLLEYAQATDPKLSDRELRPSIRFVNVDGSLRGAIQHRRNKAATDVEITAEAAGQPDTAVWETLINDEEEDDFGTYTLVTTADTISPSITPRRFYRLRVEFR